MSRRELLPPTTDFGIRLEKAIEQRGWTRSKAEREIFGGGEYGKSAGRIQRLLGIGESPILQPGPDVIRQLADALHVAYEWLAIGTGPVKPGEWAAPPDEAAESFALKAGISSLAIEAAKVRYDGLELTALEWISAFMIEAGRQERVARARRLLVETPDTRRPTTSRARRETLSQSRPARANKA